MTNQNKLIASLEKLTVYYIQPNEYRPEKRTSVTTFVDGSIPARLLMPPIHRVLIQEEQIKVYFAQKNNGTTKIIVGRSPEVLNFDEFESHVLVQGKPWDITLSRENGAIMVFETPYNGIGSAKACMIAARKNPLI